MLDLNGTGNKAIYLKWSGFVLRDDTAILDARSKLFRSI